MTQVSFGQALQIQNFINRSTNQPVHLSVSKQRGIAAVFNDQLPNRNRCMMTFIPKRGLFYVDGDEFAALRDCAGNHHREGILKRLTPSGTANVFFTPNERKMFVGRKVENGSDYWGISVEPVVTKSKLSVAA